MAEERAVSEVVQDILRNLQEIVRSEVRLAKVEIREELKQAAFSGAWITGGAVGVLNACIFLLWTLATLLRPRCRCGPLLCLSPSCWPLPAHC
jgi:hypothetical protein